MFGYRFVIQSRASHSNNPTTRLTVHFGSAMIDTTVTRDATVVDDDWVIRAANPHGARLIVGLDCKWKRNYSWTTSKVAVLQLCAGTRCLVLQLFYVDHIPAFIRTFLADPDVLYVDRIPASIRSFFANPDVLFVGIGVGEDDVAKLDNYDDYGLTCAGHVDLEGRCNDYDLAPYTGGRRLSLKGFAREVLGLLMEKARGVTMSNWEKHHLGLDREWKPSYGSWTTTTSKVGRRPSSSSAPRRHPSPLAPALRRAVDRMGCPRPREGSAVVIVLMVLLFLLAAQAGVCSHPSPTVAAKHHQAVHVRNKLLNNDTRGTGGNSRGAVADAAYSVSVDLCSEEVVELCQGSAGSLPNGIPSYSVSITNMCLDCTVWDVHVSCGEFASTELVDPSDFRRLSYNDCLVKNGGPIGPSETITFDYSNSFIYKMNVATVSCGDI